MIAKKMTLFTFALLCFSSIFIYSMDDESDENFETEEITVNKKNGCHKCNKNINPRDLVHCDKCTKNLCNPCFSQRLIFECNGCVCKQLSMGGTKASLNYSQECSSKKKTKFYEVYHSKKIYNQIGSQPTFGLDGRVDGVEEKIIGFMIQSIGKFSDIDDNVVLSYEKTSLMPFDKIQNISSKYSTLHKIISITDSSKPYTYDNTYGLILNIFSDNKKITFKNDIESTINIIGNGNEIIIKDSKKTEVIHTNEKGYKNTVRTANSPTVSISLFNPGDAKFELSN